MADQAPEQKGDYVVGFDQSTMSKEDFDKLPESEQDWFAHGDQGSN